MKSVCAWCKKEMGEVPGGENNPAISHGICPECHKEQMNKIEEMKKKAAEKSAGEENGEKKTPEINFPLK